MAGGSPEGTLYFEGNIAPSNLKLARSGDNLLVTVTGMNNQIVLWNSVADSYAQVATIETSEGVRLTDNNGTLTLYSTAASAVTDVAMLSSIPQSAHVIIRDTASNVFANPASLVPLALHGPLTSIVLTDSTPPTRTLTYQQYVSDAALLNLIQSPFNLKVTGVSAANLLTVANSPHVTAITLSDTQANLQNNMAAIDALAAKGVVSTITPTDPNPSVFSVNLAQYEANQAFFKEMVGSYSIALSGVPASQVKSLLAQPHVAQVSVVDTQAKSYFMKAT